MNKIKSFKSFSDVLAHEATIKLAVENNTKREELSTKIASILDSMEITSLEGLDEEQKTALISQLFGEISEESDDSESEDDVPVVSDDEEVEEITEAIKVEGKRDAKKVVTVYNKIFNKVLVDLGAMSSESILGCIKYLMHEAMVDANFHREALPVSKMIKGNIKPLEIKMAGLGGHFVKIGPATIKTILDKYYSDIANAAGWGGQGIVEGTALYLEQIKQEGMGQAAVNQFNQAFEGEDVRIDLDSKLNESNEVELITVTDETTKLEERNAFLGARAKAIEEDLEEFEFNGKMYPVTVNESTVLNEGTRGQFGKIDKAGNITSVYTHYDSYPDNMLPIIKKSFKNGKNVDDVLSKGANSGLSTDISKINFYNDGTTNTTGSIKNIDNYLKDADRDGGAEFVYLWDEKSKKWMMADLYQGSGLVPAFESVVTEAKFVKDFNRDVLNAKTKEEVLELYPNAEFFIGKSDHFFGELDGNLFFKAYYTKAQKEFKIKSVYSEKGSNYVHLYNESIVTEGKSEVNAFLAMIAKDYQFDKKHDDYTGFLNTDPSDMDDVAIEFINNVDKYKSLMKKHGLSLQSGYSDKEAIFVKESVVNEAKELFQLDIDSDEHGALGLSVTMKELKDVYNKNKKDINDVEDLLLKFVYAQPEDFAANDTEGMEISGANVGDVQTMLAKEFGIKESVVNEAAKPKEVKAVEKLIKAKGEEHFDVEGTWLFNHSTYNDDQEETVQFSWDAENGYDVTDEDGRELYVGTDAKAAVKAFKSVVDESVVNEAEIKSDEEFQEYAFTVLKKAFGDDFDEAKGQEIVDGILSKSDGDYGAAVGMLTSSLG